MGTKGEMTWWGEREGREGEIRGWNLIGGMTGRDDRKGGMIGREGREGGMEGKDRDKSEGLERMREGGMIGRDKMDGGIRGGLDGGFREKREFEWRDDRWG